MSIERIKNIRDSAFKNIPFKVDVDDFSWALGYAIEQAERTEYLEKEYEVRHVCYLEEHIERLEKLVSYHQGKQKEAEDLNEPYRHQNKRYREIIQDFIDHAEDYNISRVEKYRLRKLLEGDSDEWRMVRKH